MRNGRVCLLYFAKEYNLELSAAYWCTTALFIQSFFVTSLYIVKLLPRIQLLTYTIKYLNTVSTRFFNSQLVFYYESFSDMTVFIFTFPFKYYNHIRFGSPSLNFFLLKMLVRQCRVLSAVWHCLATSHLFCAERESGKLIWRPDKKIFIKE